MNPQNDKREWEDVFDERWFYFADPGRTTTLNQHRWSMKDVVRGLIAEAQRRERASVLSKIKECRDSYDWEKDTEVLPYRVLDDLLTKLTEPND